MRLNTPIVEWRDRSVWIVGASAGIGMALAKYLISLEATVTVSARDSETLKREFDDQANVVSLDVTDEHDINNAIGLLASQHQPIDTVFWLPATYQPGALIKQNIEDTLSRLDTNILSAFRVFPRVAKHWIQNPIAGKKYHWIWFSSLASYRGLPNSSDYGASRAAITHFAESTYLELKNNRIDISVVSPGFVDTRLTQKNEFHMPFMISAKEAAHRTIDGLRKGKFEVHFPKRMSFWFKLLRILPIGVYLRLMKLTRK